MALKLFTSNRMEVLVDSLGTLLGEPLHSALTKEMIVVQSRGMQRWISMKMASRFGIWANTGYPFPNAMVFELFESLQLEHPDESSFSREVMCWKIIGMLPEMIGQEAFRPLCSYLADDRNGLKCFQLAGKIADTFDQYTLYRPDMLAAWEESSDASDWQALLWRKLTGEACGKHRGVLKEEFCRKIRSGHVSSALFPERITLFGISYLPLFYLEIVEALSALIDVNLFVLSPSREYWGDIVSRKEMTKMEPAGRSFRTEGDPLLASLGTIGRDFCDMLVDISDNAVEQEELYEYPGEDSMLHLLQSHMLDLTESTGIGEAYPVDASDRSLQIHSCHSPLREIEVLHDNLLFMLDSLPALKPGDILVMMPDVEIYSPYISAVFSGSRDGVPALSYSIADRKFLNEGEIASSVLKLLAIAGGRMTAPELFDLLSSPPVRRRFGLDGSNVEAIREWIEGTRIRWGIDESDRVERALPAYRENSWRAGLDRLLLGYALPDTGELFHGTLPSDLMAAEDDELLGIFAGFIDSVERHASAIKRARTLSEWQEFLLSMLEEFILADEDSERELIAIYEVVNGVSRIAADSGFRKEVSAEVMISWLRLNLEREEHGLGFMTGAITFCSMLPMRSIPFRVVAMIGMNDGVFPRQDRSPGFDHIARSPRRGDRSKRSEDRYLFLETILSARDLLYISYIGQSVRNNSEIPPSVLVSELLDTVQRSFLFSGDESAERRLVTLHRLQAFHPAYFCKESPLFSYSQDNFHALGHFASAGGDVRPFIDAPLAEPSAEYKTVSLERLIRFYENPAAFFLAERLGIRFGNAKLPLEEREPFSVGALERYFIRQELLDEELKGGNPELLLSRFQSRGVLPPARHGEMVFTSLLEEVRLFVGKVREKKGGGAALAPIEAELQLGSFRLIVRLERISADCRMQVRCASMKPRDQIRIWIEHLVLNALAPEGYPRQTLLIMTDKARRYEKLDNAEIHLECLLDYYWQGQREPLPFFPSASLAWAEKSGKDDAIRLDAAIAAWEDGYTFAGEGSNSAINRCFGPEPPFGLRFRTISDELLLPMISSGGKA